MNVEDLEDIGTIESQLEACRVELDGHTQTLAQIDGELERLAVERERHELLATACDSLDRLAELGAAGLFWGEEAAAGAGTEHVRRARERGAGFREQLAEIEGRRRDVVAQVRDVQSRIADLEDDLYDAQEQEERRRLEWLVEREISSVSNRRERMPWTRGGEDDRRLLKSLSTSLLIGLLIAIVLPMVDLPFPERAELAEVPERLAKLVQQERARAVLEPAETQLQPKPVETEPPPPPEPEPVTEPQPTQDAPVLAEVPARAPKEAPATAEQPSPQPAKKAGLLAFSDKLSDIKDNRPAARLGSKARISGAGDKAVTRTERSMVSTDGPGSSGGINLASISRDIGGGGAGGQIGGVAVTQASSSIGGGVAGGGRPVSGGPGMSRTDEEIQIVFDRHKAALYRLYNRELRNDPTLRGQMVLRLTIEPDGRVSLCALEASDMNAPALSAQIVDRVRAFDFGAKDGIPPVTILYPIDFLPAA